MKIYHIDRDFTLSLKEQKKHLAKEYNNFYYWFSDGKKIHFQATGKKEGKTA